MTVWYNPKIDQIATGVFFKSLVCWQIDWNDEYGYSNRFYLPFKTVNTNWYFIGEL